VWLFVCLNVGLCVHHKECEYLFALVCVGVCVCVYLCVSSYSHRKAHKKKPKKGKKTFCRNFRACSREFHFFYHFLYHFPTICASMFPPSYATSPLFILSVCYIRVYIHHFLTYSPIPLIHPPAMLACAFCLKKILVISS